MRISSSLAGILVVFSAIGLAPARLRAAAAPVYSITDLGTNYLYVTGMNNAGQLVGMRDDGQPRSAGTPFLYTGGQSTDLPAGTRPIGITDSGQVFIGTPGWVYRSGDLNRDRIEYGTTTMANGQGYQVGESRDYSWSNYGIVRTGGYVLAPSAADGTPGRRVYFGLPPEVPGYSTLTASSSVTAINDAGQVAGNNESWWNGPRHAFLGQISMHNEPRPAPGVDLGTLGGETSWANGLNNKGEVVGKSLAADGSTHAFVYRDGKMIDLGGSPDTPATALAINNSGEIVGRLTTLKPYPYPDPIGPNTMVTDRNFGVLWKDGKMIKLDDLLPAGSGWLLESAVRINDAGQILAEGMHDGQSGRVLLTPLSPDAAPVPEPGTLAVFVLLAGALVLRTRSKRPTVHAPV